MKRAELVKLLELVQPALADTNLVPAYTCFMFRPKSICAYDDRLGIVAKVNGVSAAPFAVAGMTLLGLLQNSRADEVEFEVGDEIIVRTGKSTIKLPYFTEEEYLFAEPNEKWGGEVAINEELIKGLEIAMITSSKNQAEPAINGVCFNLKPKEHFDGCTLFSCDGDAITRYYAHTKVDGNSVYTVPNAFCNALLKISGETETTQGKLQLSQGWAKASLNNGFVLYGRMIVNDDPLDHQKLIDETMTGKQPFIDLPLGLSDALARARVLADVESAKTVLTVEGTKLKLVTETHMGVVRDELRTKGLNDVEALVHASLVHRSIAVCDQISIRENCTCYKLDDTVLQVVSNIGE